MEYISYGTFNYILLWDIYIYIWNYSFNCNRDDFLQGCNLWGMGAMAASNAASSGYFCHQKSANNGPFGQIHLIYSFELSNPPPVFF